MFIVRKTTLKTLPVCTSVFLWNLIRSWVFGCIPVLSLFVFLQTVIGCWMPSDDCNRRGKSRRNAVQPLCLSYSLILLTLSLCCVRQDKQTGHSCSIRSTVDRHVSFLMWWKPKEKERNHRRPPSQIYRTKWKNWPLFKSTFLTDGLHRYTLHFL